MSASQIARSTEAFFKPFKGPKVQSRTPLPKESEKRKQERVIYTEKKAVYLEAHPFCEFEGCRKPSFDLHHKAGRGMSYLDEATFCALCRGHHNFVHDNPKEAEAMGLLV